MRENQLPDSSFNGKKSKPSRSLTLRNGFNRSHNFTMKAATIKIADIADKDKERFWKTVEVSESSACWVWKGRKTPSNYGLFGVNGRDYRANRIALLLSTGELDEELFAIHSCDNPPCCNPAHIRAGTHMDNMRDKCARSRCPSGASHHFHLHPERVARGKRSGKYTKPEKTPRGESHGCSKLTELQVIEIRQRSDAGEKGRYLAGCFNVTEGTISEVVLRKTWTHI